MDVSLHSISSLLEEARRAGISSCSSLHLRKVPDGREHLRKSWRAEPQDGLISKVLRELDSNKQAGPISVSLVEEMALAQSGFGCG